MYKILIVIVLIRVCVVQSMNYGRVDHLDMTLKILGGRHVRWADWNFMVYLSIEVTVNNFYGIKQCSATVLNRWWLLSAAHCFDYDVPNGNVERGHEKLTIYVIVGKKKVKHGEKSKLYAKPFCHYDYAYGSVLNDICVLRLSKSLKFSEDVSIVKLPARQIENINTGEICKTAGWGGKIKQLMNLNTEVNLKEAFQRVEHNEICEEIFHKIFNTNYSRDLHMCSALINPLNDDEKYGPYKGDSGGPLICQGVQYGIISFGPSKDFITILPKGFLGVSYTRVDHYLQWINDTIMQQNNDGSSIRNLFSSRILSLLLYHIILKYLQSKIIGFR